MIQKGFTDSSQKTARILFLAFLLHISICLTFIFFNKFLKKTRLSRIYKVYIMPGPFFSEASISKSFHMFVSWKQNNGNWTIPENHALASFNKYQTTLNPVYLNQNRLERAIYQELVRKSRNQKKDPLKSAAWSNLKGYIAKEIVPIESDSAIVTIVMEESVKKDTVLFKHKLKLK